MWVLTARLDRAGVTKLLNLDLEPTNSFEALDDLHDLEQEEEIVLGKVAFEQIVKETVRACHAVGIRLWIEPKLKDPDLLQDVSQVDPNEVLSKGSR